MVKMGPSKKAMAAKSMASKPKQAPAPPGEEVGGSGNNRKDISNMLTSLKGSSDPNKVQVLQKYQSLSRFDPEKANILKKWKLDKSCKWVSSYSQEVTQEKATKHKELEGYGTRHLIWCST